MRSINFHLKILIAILIVLGAGSIAYQVLILKLPISADETDEIWNVDANIEFVANTDSPIKLQMFIPPQNTNHVSLNESFISNGYGFSISRKDGNRRVTWSSRRASGDQVLYYRLLLTKRYTSEINKDTGATYRDSLPLDGAEALAANALLNPIRQHSADLETFVSESILAINNHDNENVRLLLNGNQSIERKVKIIETLLSLAHIPIEPIHTLQLLPTQRPMMETWLRTYTGSQWLYFNLHTGEQGLPEDRLIWWVGDHGLIDIEGGKKVRVTFNVSANPINALNLSQRSDANIDISILEYSLYGLPLQTQDIYRILVMIPVGVLVILLLRNLGGLQTLGTFTPVLISLAFRETQLLYGIILFASITALGLLLRSYLEHLKLQMLPRLSVVLTFVVITIAVMSIFSYKLGFERGLSVALFPMVILTMTIERLSIVWEERGGSNALKIAIGTLVAATLAYLLMAWSDLNYFVFTFPGILLLLMAMMLAMGRYRGYRLTELFRFKAFLKDNSA